MGEKASKGTFLKPEKFQDHRNELRKRKGLKQRARRRKGGEEKQAMVAQWFDTNGPFGYNVIKNPARYILT